MVLIATLSLLTAVSAAAIAATNDSISLDCPWHFRFMHPSVLKLNQSIQTGKEHRISLENGKLKLYIGLLDRGDVSFARSLVEAVKSGAHSEIDAGAVVGPKVLNLISRVREMAPADRPLMVRGLVDVQKLIVKRNEQVSGRHFARDLQSLKWSNADVQDFEEALDALGIRDACLQHWRTLDVSSCGSMRFETAPSGELIWRRI